MMKISPGSPQGCYKNGVLVFRPFAYCENVRDVGSWMLSRQWIQSCFESSTVTIFLVLVRSNAEGPFAAQNTSNLSTCRAYSRPRATAIWSSTISMRSVVMLLSRNSNMLCAISCPIQGFIPSLPVHKTSTSHIPDDDFVGEHDEVVMKSVIG